MVWVSNFGRGLRPDLAVKRDTPCTTCEAGRTGMYSQHNVATAAHFTILACFVEIVFGNFAKLQLPFRTCLIASGRSSQHFLLRGADATRSVSFKAFGIGMDKFVTRSKPHGTFSVINGECSVAHAVGGNDETNQQYASPQAARADMQDVQRRNPGAAATIGTGASNGEQI